MTKDLLNNPLALHLSAFVPLEIESLQRQGGATDWHFREARERMAAYRERGGESFLYSEGFEKGKTAEAVGVLVECLAVLAFVPGGIRAFGCHFEARTIGDKEERT